MFVVGVSAHRYGWVLMSAKDWAVLVVLLLLSGSAGLLA